MRFEYLDNNGKSNYTYINAECIFNDLIKEDYKHSTTTDVAIRLNNMLADVREDLELILFVNPGTTKIELKNYNKVTHTYTNINRFSIESEEKEFLIFAAGLKIKGYIRGYKF